MDTVEELGRASIGASKRYALKSKHVDQIFQIDVALPIARMPEGKTFPVIYALDGNSSFGIAAQTARLLQDNGMPAAFVVGIGYRFDRARPHQAQFFETRTRDYTPTSDEAWLTMTKTELVKQDIEVAGATTGGARAFLAFIEEELKPFIAARYPIDTNDQTLTGMSFGGLFTLYALFQAPGTFARYAAFSPSLWWENRTMFKKEAALAARVKDLPVRLFVSVGAEEEGAGAPYNMVSNLEALVPLLQARNYPNLKLKHHIFADETHMSVYPASISRGLRAVFE